MAHTASTPVITFVRQHDRPGFFKHAEGSAIDGAVTYGFSVMNRSFDGIDITVILCGARGKVRAEHKLALRAAIVGTFSRHLLGAEMGEDHAAHVALYREATRARDLGEQHDAHICFRRDCVLTLDCLRIRDLGGDWLGHDSFERGAHSDDVRTALVRDGLAMWDMIGIHITPRGRRFWADHRALADAMTGEQYDAHVSARVMAAALMPLDMIAYVEARGYRTMPITNITTAAEGEPLVIMGYELLGPRGNKSVVCKRVDGTLPMADVQLWCDCVDYATAKVKRRVAA